MYQQPQPQPAQPREVFLQRGRYTMRVDRIVENRRQFQSANGTRYVNDIYFSSGSDIYRGELITTGPGQFEFVVGSTYSFDVTDATRHEIAPCQTMWVGPTNPGQPSQYPTTAALGEAPDEFSPNVGGKAHCFALSWAKDLAVARIRMGYLTGLEDDFMQSMFYEAWQMNKWLLNPTPTQETAINSNSHEAPMPF